MLVTAPNFMKECDIVIDPHWGETADAGAPMDNKKVFINTDYFEYIVPTIARSSNVTLVVHHSDRFMDRIMFDAVKPYCSRILAQNCEIQHPKLIQVPIGVAYDKPVPGQKPTLTEDRLRAVKDMDLPRDINVYVNVSLHNPQEPKFTPARTVRQRCLEYFPSTASSKPVEEYLKDLRRSKYVICPMGHGIDTHRFYEAAYMGARPVVVTSGLDPMYRKFGAVILNDWDEPLPEWTPPDVPDEVFHTGFWMTI
jgi:hypothetical protein